VSTHFPHRHLDVSCELEADDAGARTEEWRRLREEAGLGSDPIDGGTRLWLRADAREAAEDLAGREAACCGFLDLDVAVDGDRLRLDITSLAPEAAPLIALLTGSADLG
jgi:hypothetical protein